MTKRLFILAHDIARQRAIDAVREAPAGYAVTIAEPKRNLEQNARMWAMLTDVATQLPWHGIKLRPDDWKLLFLDSLKRELRMIPNLDGTGFVALGMSTSRMSVREMRDLIELMFAFGAERQVEWTDPEQVAA